MQFSAPDDGRKNRLKHVERLTEINKLRNVASCLLYSANIRVLAMHGPVNVKLADSSLCFLLNTLQIPLAALQLLQADRDTAKITLELTL